MLSIFVSSNEMIGFPCISSPPSPSPFVRCICIMMSSDLWLEQHHTKTVQIGINAINRKMAIKQMKPDSTFRAWNFENAHSISQKNMFCIQASSSGSSVASVLTSQINLTSDVLVSKTFFNSSRMQLTTEWKREERDL